MKPLLAHWNLDFSPRAKRRANLRREIRRRLRCEPKGKGNRAWRRWLAMLNEPGTLIWPDYALLTRGEWRAQ